MSWRRQSWVLASSAPVWWMHPWRCLGNDQQPAIGWTTLQRTEREGRLLAWRCMSAGYQMLSFCLEACEQNWQRRQQWWQRTAVTTRHHVGYWCERRCRRAASSSTYLADFLDKEAVQRLSAQRCASWGTSTAEQLVDRGMQVWSVCWGVLGREHLGNTNNSIQFQFNFNLMCKIRCQNAAAQ